jgi:hypothetical protein
MLSSSAPIFHLDVDGGGEIGSQQDVAADEALEAAQLEHGLVFADRQVGKEVAALAVADRGLRHEQRGLVIEMATPGRAAPVSSDTRPRIAAFWA